MDEESKKVDLSDGVLLVCSLAALYIVSQNNYLLFHTIAELFSIVIAYSLSIIAGNSRRYFRNSYLLFIGIAYLFVASLDVLHTLAFKGMGVFKGFDENNLAPQIWIAARYLESSALLIAPVFFRKRLRIAPTALIFFIITSLLLLTLFYWRIFPECFITGVGLTAFKINSEHVIVVILIAALALLHHNRKEFEKKVLNLLMLSIGATIVTEMFFTLYANAYGKSNLIGHLFKIVSFYFMYKAIIQIGLREPYALMFRDLKQNEERLKTALLQADEANKAKSDFLANMSHELRTPLNAIIGFSEIMHDEFCGEVTGEQKEFLNNIRVSGQHLLLMINDILDLSKVEAGKMYLEPAEMGVREVLESCLIMLKEKAMKNRIKLRTEIAVDIGTIHADERKIKQVVFNLLSNAVKFTLDGGSVMLEARRMQSSKCKVQSEMMNNSELDADFIEISVTDTGIGIKAEDMDKLFNPFQQINSELSQKRQGTGLGLNLSKKFVERHGGRIRAESEYGKGSRFIFEVPVLQ